MTPVSLDDVAMAFARQANSCRDLGSSQYGDLLDALAVDAEQGGLVGRLVADRPERPVHDALPLRLLGAVHRLALRGEAPALAARYRSCGGDGSPIPLDDFVALVETHRDEIDVELGRQVQTNEVGRSLVPLSLVHWLTTLGVDRVDWIEIGASAGLNLHFEKYGADTARGTLGDPSSSLRFDASWFTAPPPIVAQPVVCERVSGVDISPLDVHEDDDRRRLLSFVWPDQLERFERLRTALTIARSSDVVVERGSADEFLAERLVDDPSIPRVVFHSIVWQYLAAEVRNGVREAITSARASRSAPVVWARMEPSGAVADVRVTVYDGRSEPVERRLAEVGYHGQGLRWL
ncbi:MAG: hypothetical protein RIS41_2202 [Actinomycetota bacterium]